MTDELADPAEVWLHGLELLVDLPASVGNCALCANNPDTEVKTADPDTEVTARDPDTEVTTGDPDTEVTTRDPDT